MSASSVRSTVIGSIVLISSMAFVSGVFLMSGLNGMMSGQRGYAGLIALTPSFILVIVLHARQIIAQVAPGSSREGTG